ncbi:hypothetical protein C5167_012602 [Papaver somniferum]|uniref:Uncharacterized protein n=1 Tax=Papaver somniferum TaxID=3469 RepID=A0A4Y7J1U7_PAPSO|nr:hypothetical protein C5167_012602 [Papaver somniferum]
MDLVSRDSSFGYQWAGQGREERAYGIYCSAVVGTRVSDEDVITGRPLPLHGKKLNKDRLSVTNGDHITSKGHSESG